METPVASAMPAVTEARHLQTHHHAVLKLWTIGHSNRPLEAFIDALAAHRIEAVADVRRFPGSRRLPEFAAAPLECALDAHGIAYHWIPALGGRRRPHPESANVGWRNPGFRGYADHLATAEFAAGLFELLLAARGLRTAVMCAEALWWRCHRRLIADVLVSLGAEVVHIRDAGAPQAHGLAPPARLVNGRLSYG
jgi:uncharacterized protein (DUF488 family)